MSDMPACRGLLCSDCGVFLATAADDDYAFGELEAFFKMVPNARKNLDALRSGL